MTSKLSIGNLLPEAAACKETFAQIIVGYISMIGAKVKSEVRLCLRRIFECLSVFRYFGSRIFQVDGFSGKWSSILKFAHYRQC